MITGMGPRSLEVRCPLFLARSARNTCQVFGGAGSWPPWYNEYVIPELASTAATFKEVIMPKDDEKPAEAPVEAGLPSFPPVDDVPSASKSGATGGEKLWEGIEQRDMRREVAGKPTVFHECKQINTGQFDGPYAITLCQDIESGDTFTFGTGAAAIVEKLAGATFPFKGIIAKREGSSGRTYYVFEDLPPTHHPQG